MNSFKSILAVVLISSFAYSCKKEVKQAADPIKYVKVHSITEGDEKSKLVFNGKIKEKSEVDLSFRVGGPLVKLPIKQGDYVKAGSLIASIDRRDYIIRAESAKTRFRQAKGEYERYKELFENKKIPANTYEKIEAGYLLSKSDYENAQHQLKDTELRSPMSGYVFNKYVENFQTVNPGEPIVSIIDKSDLEVIVHIPENQLDDINTGKEFYLNISSAGLLKTPVSVLNIAEKAGANGLYEVKFKLPNHKDISVYPGMTAEVFMYFHHLEEIITIPSNAVFSNSNNSYVWIYNKSENTVNKRKVTISAIQSKGKISITEGLKVGEAIVAAGVHYLQEGQKVQPVIEPSKTNVGGLL